MPDYTETDGKQEDFNIVPKFINGTVAGLLGLTMLFPLDSVKMRLQNQQITVYTGLIHGLWTIFRYEGVLGLYHGLGVTLSWITPEMAANLVANDYFKHLLRSENNQLSITDEALAGALAGLVQSNLTAPGELLRIQLQKNAAQRLHREYKTPNARAVAADIMREKGLLGFYRGYIPTVLRDVPFAMIYFPLYTMFSQQGPRRSADSQKPANWVSFFAAFCAGLIAGVLVTPFDVIKTRLQAREQEVYSGVLDCFQKIIREEGLHAIFKGVIVRGLFVAQLMGITQMIYTFDVAEHLKMDYLSLKHMFNSWDSKKKP